MAKWKDLSNAEKDRIAALYKRGDLRKAFSDEAERLGVTAESLGRYVRMHVSGDEPPYKRYARAKQASAMPPSSTSEQKSDDQRWHEFLNDHARSVLRVMHLCDIHAPFQDEEAYALAIEMVRRFQPNVVVVGSDFADFYLLSSFEGDPDVEGEDDELDGLEREWTRHIADVSAAAPSAMLHQIQGNHEMRITRYLKRQAPNMYKRMLRDYETIIRAGGRVLFRGYRDEVLIGNLQIEHGTRTNEHSAKSRLLDEGGQCHVWAGHTHKRNYYSVTGRFFTVEGITSGCLCQIPAHYMPQGRTANTGRHQEQGTALATYDMASGEVHFDNLLFRRNGTGPLFTLWGGQRIEANTSKLPIDNLVNACYTSGK